MKSFPNSCYLSNLSEHGVSFSVILALARRSSLNTTQRDIYVSVDKLRSAVEELVL